jgi:hypothetical protein
MPAEAALISRQARKCYGQGDGNWPGTPILLIPIATWFSGLKACRRDWWLSYL